MMEYLKRKLCKISADNLDIYPRYYEENGKLIKETEDGEKWVIKLDTEYKEVLLERLS